MFSCERFKVQFCSFFKVPCVPGSYEWNRVCLSCPVGSHQSAFGTTRCNECTKMQVTEDVGATSPSQCIRPGNLNCISCLR